MAILLCACSIMMAVRTLAGCQLREFWIDPAVEESLRPTGSDSISFESGIVIPVGFDVEKAEHLVAIVTQCVSVLSRHVALVAGSIPAVGDVVPFPCLDIALVRDVIRPRVILLLGSVMFWREPDFGDEPVVVWPQERHQPADLARWTVMANLNAFMTTDPRSERHRVRMAQQTRPLQRIRRTARATAAVHAMTENPPICFGNRAVSRPTGSRRYPESLRCPCGNERRPCADGPPLERRGEGLQPGRCGYKQMGRRRRVCDDDRSS